MKNDKLIMEVAAIGIIGIVVAPVIINTAINLVTITANGINNGVAKVRYNKKIKKGLKDGSIIEVDGVYYGVVLDHADEA